MPTTLHRKKQTGSWLSVFISKCVCRIAEVQTSLAINSYEQKNESGANIGLGKWFKI